MTAPPQPQAEGIQRSPFRFDARDLEMDEAYNLHKWFWNCLEQMAWSGINADELTAEHKFAIAVLGGARFESKMGEDGLMHMTTEPCGVQKINGKWNVFLMDPSRQKQ